MELNSIIEPEQRRRSRVPLILLLAAAGLFAGVYISAATGGCNGSSGALGFLVLLMLIGAPLLAGVAAALPLAARETSSGFGAVLAFLVVGGAVFLIALTVAYTVFLKHHC